LSERGDLRRREEGKKEKKRKGRPLFKGTSFIRRGYQSQEERLIRARNNKGVNLSVERIEKSYWAS